MRNVKLVLEYDGTDLCGWQRQKGDPSVQQHLEEALSEMLKTEVKVTGASRTDAGVHALGQVANFKTDSNIPLHGFRRGLNSSLPDSIAIVAAHEVGEEFHARFSARGKRYRYRILATSERAPLVRHRAWHRPRPLNLDAMRNAAPALLGEHDFSAFRATGCSANTPIRKVGRIDLNRDGQEIVLVVEGNAFLRNMVRIIAGTLVGVGEGRFDSSELSEILASGDRTRAGQTAPAHGLTLVEVFYPPAEPAPISGQMGPSGQER
jgi:tRNA pseudouridine38-40 synthase